MTEEPLMCDNAKKNGVMLQVGFQCRQSCPDWWMKNEEVVCEWLQGNLAINVNSLAWEEAQVSKLDSLALLEVWTKSNYKKA